MNKISLTINLDLNNNEELQDLFSQKDIKKFINENLNTCKDNIIRDLMIYKAINKKQNNKYKHKELLEIIKCNFDIKYTKEE